ncbi:hypothetical protein HDA40_001744 [Hamadaea flava]|uniref:Uncharacterized protein n=1 Tax=Hamadaea flava TaxID=1742688 RepID=A0ABV8LQZ0_9ACTN|nr:hypothetical protein [Hamadaea flava]MCP2323237.1 hypothetical protein [Hamadaea flava]
MSDSLHDLEIQVAAELALQAASHPEDALARPVTEWQFDPADAQREQVGLRSLLGAIEALERDAPRADAAESGLDT